MKSLKYYFHPCRKGFVFLRTGLLGVLLLLHTACENFLKVDLPSSQLTADDIFKEASTAEAAMLAIYADMRDDGILHDVSYFMGMYADELDYYGTENTQTNFYTNSLLPSESYVSSWWNNAYYLIYSANSLLEKIVDSESLDQDVVNRLTGEAFFVRGLLHFYLVNLYGDIPYIVTTDYLQNQDVRRQPVSEVYGLITEDLTEASALLDDAYTTTYRTRPNKATVMALLARVYLYCGEWQKAVDAASYVISQSGLYTWETDLDKVFLKESTTTLWQWDAKYTTGNTYEGSQFIFTSVPPANVALPTELVSSFDPSDLRKAHWMKEVSDGTQFWYYAYKYKEQSSTSSSKEYTILFRLGELYLVRAEAYAELEDLTAARQDLNVIRGRAGLDETTTDTKEELLEAVSLERRYELFTETGHRFFDLKRSGRLDDVLTLLKPGWDTTNRLLPIPEDELLLNPDLGQQNPGYD